MIMTVEEILERIDELRDYRNVGLSDRTNISDIDVTCDSVGTRVIIFTSDETQLKAKVSTSIDTLIDHLNDLQTELNP